MQYDVRRDSKKTKKGAAAAESPNQAPLLRERLIDVVRRDRAIAAIAVAQEARESEPAAAPEARASQPPKLPTARTSHPPTDETPAQASVEAEAKSGTHARVPGRSRKERDEVLDALGLELPPPDPKLFDFAKRDATRLGREEVLDNVPTKTVSMEEAIAGSPTQVGEPRDIERIASWIEEEIIEIDAASDIPIEFVPAAPPPLPDVARSKKRSKPPAPPEVALAEQARVEQGLELILESDGEPVAKQEPIRTRTMARLLAGHGYAARALSIYDHLIARDPSDASLRAEAEALRAVKK